MYTNVIIATFLLLSFGIKDIKLSSNDNFSINEYYKEQYTSKKSLEIYLSANDYSRLPDSLLLLSFNYTKFSENKLNDCIKSLLSAKKIFYETHDENESDSIQEFIKYWKVTQPWCYGKFLQIMPMLHYSFDVPNKELAYRLTKVNCNILYKNITLGKNNGITTYIDPKNLPAISFFLNGKGKITKSFKSSLELDTNKNSFNLLINLLLDDFWPSLEPSLFYLIEIEFFFTYDGEIKEIHTLPFLISY